MAHIMHCIIGNDNAGENNARGRSTAVAMRFWEGRELHYSQEPNHCDAFEKTKRQGSVSSGLQKVEGTCDDILFNFRDAVHTESCPSP